MVAHCPEGTDQNIFSSDFFRSDSKRRADVVFSVRDEFADVVFLVGTFNNWSESHPLKKVCPGIWQVTLSDSEISDGDAYKFKVYREGGEFYFTDPYAMENDGAPNYNSVYREVSYDASKTYKTEKHVGFLNMPMNVFSIRADKQQGGARQYSDIARDLIPYMMQMGYTHLCMSGVFEEYYDFSSKQTLKANFAPRKEQGGIDSLHELVHLMHNSRIGVLLDRGITDFIDGAYTDESFLLDDARYWLDMYGFDGLVSSATSKESSEMLSRVYRSLKEEYKNAYFIDRELCGIRIAGADAVLRDHDAVFSEFTPTADTRLDRCLKMAAMSYILMSEGRGFTSEGYEYGISAKACEEMLTVRTEDDSRFQLFISDLNSLYLENPCLWSGEKTRDIQKLGDAIVLNCRGDGSEFFFAADTSGRGCQVAIPRLEGKFCVLDSYSERYGGGHRVPHMICSDRLTLEPYEAIILIGD